jgi:hypothetical protein
MAREYIEQRDGGYYFVGSRVSLDSVVYEFLLAPAGFDGAPFAEFGGLQKGLFITVKFQLFSS